MPAPAPLSILAATLLGAAPVTKVALLPIQSGVGVDDKTAVALSEATAVALHKVPGIQLVTQQDMAAVLGFEKQKALLGCQSESCLAEIGGALGVERLVIPNLSKVGESWLVTLKMLDARKAQILAISDRRLRKGTLDDVLDALPRMVDELFAAAPLPRPSPPDASVPPPAPPPPAPAGPDAGAPIAKTPEPTTPQQQGQTSAKPTGAKSKAGPIKTGSEDPESKETMASLRPRLRIASDASGKVFVAFPETGPTDSPLYAGDGKVFFRQPLSYRKGEGQSFKYTFWEPRVEGFPKAELSRGADLGLTLTCGSKRVTLRELPEAEEKAMVEKAVFDRQRWRRMLLAIAHDEANDVWYVVDGNAPQENPEPERARLFIVKGKQVQAHAVTDVQHERRGGHYSTEAGRLRIYAKGILKLGAEWTSGGSTVPLTWVPPESNSQKVFVGLPVYAGEKVGTPCDAFF